MVPLRDIGPVPLRLSLCFMEENILPRDCDEELSGLLWREKLFSREAIVAVAILLCSRLAVTRVSAEASTVVTRN